MNTTRSLTASHLFLDNFLHDIWSWWKWSDHPKNSARLFLQTMTMLFNDTERSCQWMPPTTHSCMRLSHVLMHPCLMGKEQMFWWASVEVKDAKVLIWSLITFSLALDGFRWQKIWMLMFLCKTTLAMFKPFGVALMKHFSNWFQTSDGSDRSVEVALVDGSWACFSFESCRVIRWAAGLCAQCVFWL